MRNVLSGLKRNEFYNPGSIVKLNVDTRHPYAGGMLEETPAYFITSSAFELSEPPAVAGGLTKTSAVPTVSSSRLQPAATAGGSDLNVIARYAEKDALMSGWMLGEKYLNGKAALVEVSYGKGKIILFAFRPQHRGQTFATFPFIFNALEK